jgi:hypothetical protein
MNNDWRRAARAAVCRSAACSGHDALDGSPPPAEHEAIENDASANSRLMALSSSCGSLLHF